MNKGYGPDYAIEKIPPLIEEMRVMVAEQYPGNWPERVKKMPDKQVRSIWHRMVRDGQIKYW